LFLDVLNAGKVSVGAPYFQNVFVPMMVPMLLLMAIAPLLGWQKADARPALIKLKWAAALAVAGGLAVWLAIDRTTALAAFGIALGIWLLAATLTELWPWRAALARPRGRWGMTLAHGGLAIIICGMTASTAWRVEDIRVMKPGESTTIAGYQFTLKSVGPVRGPNYDAMRGIFEVTKNNSPFVVLEPEKRIYDVGHQPTTEAAIRPTFLGDLYAVIGDPDGKGGYVVRLYFNPLVSWMWTGSLIMVLGAALSLSDRKYRRRAAQEHGREALA
jgi:cytochrome c-type biogenesis protein CcmF